jgi:NAD dependent epimerase/dehydratase family enzyme
VNLAGESIAAKRWSAAQKQRIRDSRLQATRSLAAAIREAQRKPVLISGSAVGFYGNRGEEPLNEASPPGTDFLAGVAQEWEAAANVVAPLTRVACIRTGIVLDRHGGALQRCSRHSCSSSAARLEQAISTCRGSTRPIG